VVAVDILVATPLLRVAAVEVEAAQVVQGSREAQVFMVTVANQRFKVRLPTRH
jgi:hypothetical protein